MPKINPFVGLFLAIVGVMVPLTLWIDGRLSARLDRIEARLDRIEARQIEHGERLSVQEAGQAALRDGQAELRDDVGRVEAGQNAAGERMARIEGTVAGALGRPLRDRVAQGPDAGGGDRAGGDLSEP